MRTRKEKTAEKVLLTEREVEMLRALWHLQCLTTTQLYRWLYDGERGLHSWRCRLSTLHRARMVVRVSLGDSREVSAWRIGREGRRKLEWFSGVRRYPGYRVLSEAGIRAQVSVNELFVHLADGERDWHLLPFEWLGPQCARLPYVRIERGSNPRILERRHRALRPRAVIAAKDADLGPRIFVELDPAWYAMHDRYIEQRLRAQLARYERVLHSRSPAGVTWYASHFGDSRPASLVFVVPDTPAAAFRRDRLAEQVEQLSTGAVDARCIVATDAAAIRELAGIDSLEAAVRTNSSSAPPLRSRP